MTSFPYRLKLFSKVITKTPALKGGSFLCLLFNHHHRLARLQLQGEASVCVFVDLSHFSTCGIKDRQCNGFGFEHHTSCLLGDIGQEE